MTPAEERVLILTPTGRDSELAQAALDGAGLRAQSCPDVETFCRELAVGAGALLVAREALTGAAITLLPEALSQQPPWSDLPLVLLTGGPGDDRRRLLEALDVLPNVTLLERPLRVATLVSTIQGALRARYRQYEVRDYLAERARAAAERERLLGQLETIIQSLAEGVVVCEPDGTIVTMNPAYRRLLGSGYEEDPRAHIGEYPALLEMASPDGRPLSVEEWPMHRVLRGERISGVEVNVRRRDTGYDFIGSYNGAPVYDARGEMLLGVLTMRDITKAKRLERELQAAYAKQRHIAETLQRSLLHRPEVGTFPALEIETVYHAAKQEADIGGDFYDVFALNDDKVALVVGDVSGKGLAAASRTAEVKYALRAFLRENPSPARALDRLNDFLLDAQTLDNQPLDSFVAIALCVLDTVSGALHAANAGAESPLRLTAAGEAEPILGNGPPLGVTAKAVYEEVALVCHPGDTLLLVTDGITEARRGREFFGYEGFVDAARYEQVPGTLDALGEHIVAEAMAFAAGSLSDDVCLLLVRRVRE